MNENTTGRHLLVLLSLALLLGGPVVSSFAGPDSAPADSETTEGELILTLPQAVARALQDNDQLLARTQEVAASEAAIGIARSNLLPSLSLEERFLRTNNPPYAFMAKLNQGRFTMPDFALPSLNSPDPINDFQSSLLLSMPLFAKSAEIGVEMSHTSHAAQQHELQRQKEAIAMQVVQGYLQAASVLEYLAVLRQAVSDAREHLRLATLRHDNGLGLYSDILRANTAVSAMEQRLTTAEKNYTVACRALGLLLGIEVPVLVADQEISILLRPLEACQEKARQRSDIMALTLHHENARNNGRLAAAAQLPVLGVSSAYQLNDHNLPFGGEGESWQVAAQLRWEFYDGARSRYQGIKADHEAKAAANYLDGLKKAVSFKVLEAYLAVDEADKNIKLADAALATALEGQRLVSLRYENALTPMVDLLEAQTSLDQCRADLVARRHEKQLAILAVSYESGILLEDLRLKDETAGEER